MKILYFLLLVYITTCSLTIAETEKQKPTRILKHIVMWKLKPVAEGASKQENALKLKALLEELPQKIEGIQTMKMGINIDSSKFAFDAVLYSEFLSMEHLHAYINHSEHKRVQKFLKKIKLRTVIVDYYHTARQPQGLKHVVMFKLRDSNLKYKKQFQALLQSMKSQIKEIQFLEAGINVRKIKVGLDVVLYTEFANQKDLDSYQKNAFHLQLKKMARSLVVEKIVVDYK